MSELGPTPRQVAVLQAIVDHAKANGHAPTIAELCLRLGVRSTNGVAEHLRNLAQKGLVAWSPRRARTLQVSARGLRFTTNTSRAA